MRVPYVLERTVSSPIVCFAGAVTSPPQGESGRAESFVFAVLHGVGVVGCGMTCLLGSGLAYLGSRAAAVHVVRYC